MAEEKGSRKCSPLSTHHNEGNPELQLKNRVVNFDYFSLALDESCDVQDIAQLLVMCDHCRLHNPRDNRD